MLFRSRRAQIWQGVDAKNQSCGIGIIEPGEENKKWLEERLGIVKIQECKEIKTQGAMRKLGTQLTFVVFDTLIAGRYQLKKCLVADPVQETYEAWDLEQKKPVYCTVYLPQKSIQLPDHFVSRKPKPEPGKKMPRESKEESVHPNVLSLLDEGMCKLFGIFSIYRYKYPAIYYVITQYVPAVNFTHFVSQWKRRVSPEHLCFIVQELGRILRTFHEKGMMTGNVRPHTLWIGQEEGNAGHLYLNGFSVLSPTLHQETTAHYMLRNIGRHGYPLYMAPEQISGTETDVRADYFSMGILLHELVAGKSPFYASETSEMVRKLAAWKMPERWKISANYQWFAPVLSALLPESVNTRDIDWDDFFSLVYDCYTRLTFEEGEEIAISRETRTKEEPEKIDEEDFEEEISSREVSSKKEKMHEPPKETTPPTAPKGSAKKEAKEAKEAKEEAEKPEEAEKEAKFSEQDMEFEEMPAKSVEEEELFEEWEDISPEIQEEKESTASHLKGKMTEAISHFYGFFFSKKKETEEGKPSEREEKTEDPPRQEVAPSTKEKAEDASNEEKAVDREALSPEKRGEKGDEEPEKTIESVKEKPERKAEKAEKAGKESVKEKPERKAEKAEKAGKEAEKAREKKEKEEPEPANIPPKEKEKKEEVIKVKPLEMQEEIEELTDEELQTLAVEQPVSRELKKEAKAPKEKKNKGKKTKGKDPRKLGKAGISQEEELSGGEEEALWEDLLSRDASTEEDDFEEGAVEDSMAKKSALTNESGKASQPEDDSEMMAVEEELEEEADEEFGSREKVMEVTELPIMHQLNPEIIAQLEAMDSGAYDGNRTNSGELFVQEMKEKQIEIKKQRNEALTPKEEKPKTANFPTAKKIEVKEIKTVDGFDEEGEIEWEKEFEIVQSRLTQWDDNDEDDIVGADGANSSEEEKKERDKKQERT